MASGGLRPVYNLIGTTSGGQLSSNQYQIANGAIANSIFTGDPVEVLNTGFIDGYAANTADPTLLGVFQGVQYTLAQQTPSGNIALQKALLAGTTFKAATEVIPRVIDDPETIYAIEADAVFIRTNLFANYNFDFSVPGDISTGQSGARLDVASQADTVTFPLKAIGILNTPGNVFGMDVTAGDPHYTIVLVKLNNRAYATGSVGI